MTFFARGSCPTKKMTKQTQLTGKSSHFNQLACIPGAKKRSNQRPNNPHDCPLAPTARRFSINPARGARSQRAASRLFSTLGGCHPSPAAPKSTAEVQGVSWLRQDEAPPGHRRRIIPTVMPAARRLWSVPGNPNAAAKSPEWTANQSTTTPTYGQALAFEPLTASTRRPLLPVTEGKAFCFQKVRSCQRH